MEALPLYPVHSQQLRQRVLFDELVPVGPMAYRDSEQPADLDMTKGTFMTLDLWSIPGSGLRRVIPKAVHK